MAQPHGSEELEPPRSLVIHDESDPGGDRDLSRSAHEPLLAYQPGLDGLRGVAIVAVLGYHGGVSLASSGGFLGVEAFFVLSGFLITALLLAEWTQRSNIRLGAFWSRRARRLLPALFVLVLVVGIHQLLGGPSSRVPGLTGDAVAALAYFGNWHQIVAGSGYFVATGPVSPLQHTWSLAIEEQFYLLWPLVVLGVLQASRRLARRGSKARPGRSRPEATRRELAVVGAVAGVAAVASAAEMAWLFRGGSGVNRVYYGTDTRAQGLLVGALLSVVCMTKGLPASRLARRATSMAGSAGLVILLGAIWRASGSSPLLYRGGFLLLDVAVGAVILAAVTADRSPVALVLGSPPLRALGKVSYGLYLWHFPIFLWLDEPTVGTSGWALFAIRAGTSLVAAVLSYFVIEKPIRERRVPLRFRLAAAPLVVGVAIVSLVVSATVPATGAVVPGATAKSNGYVLPQIGSPNIVGRFRTRDPVRALFLGDSIALTLGIGMGVDEGPYDVAISDEGLLGCGLAIGMTIESSGPGLPQSGPCAMWPQIFAADIAHVAPDVIVVELGFWDCFDQIWHGRLVHLGEPSFDAYLTHQIAVLIDVASSAGRPVVLLTVPETDAPALANGLPQPANLQAVAQMVPRLHGDGRRWRRARFLRLNVTSALSRL